MNLRKTLLGALMGVILLVTVACGVPATFLPDKPGTGFSPGYVNGIVYATWPKNASSQMSAFKIVLRLQSAPIESGEQPGKFTTENSIEYTEVLDRYRVNAACIADRFWRIQYRATYWDQDGNKSSTGAQSGPARKITHCP